MRRPSRAVQCGCLLIALLAAAFHAQTPRLHAAGSRISPRPASTLQAAATSLEPGALVKQYCVTCHNERLKTAGLLLDGLDVTRVGMRPDLWEKVVQKIRSGAMPPAGSRRPDQPVLEAFTAWLEHELDDEAAAHPNPGRPADHRLNQFEYGNAIRDLLALDVNAQSLLPADESDHGFDNIAEVLSVSPTLLERYLVAANKISRLAVGDPSSGPTVDVFDIPRSFRQDERMSDELPLGTRGGLIARHYFPLDGEYVVKVRLQRNFTNSTIRAIETREQIDVLLDGDRITRFTIGGECVGSKDAKCQRSGGAVQPTAEYERTADNGLDVRFAARAGVHSLGVAFVKKSMLTEGPAPVVLPPRHTSSTYEAPRMDIDYVRLEGPFNVTGPGDTPSRRQIFVCKPSGTEDDEPCARKILSALARRAYRRPVAAHDVETLLPFYRTGRSEGGFERGIQDALARILVSPQFLFRIERDPAAIEAGGSYRITDLELASRLSFFLWSSIPDEILLDLAERGALTDPKTLDGQVRRMLADPRATALVKNFCGQWLYLRNMKVVDPDPRLFPGFDDNLREDFTRETELFLESQLLQDRPLEELLTADYTFVNERLARFYGIRNVYGSHFRRVAVTDPHRGGLLGHASILTVTSYATRTSPVLRGKYLLDNILGAPPPPPPPNVPPLAEVSPGSMQPASMRERMEQHRRNPVCATCHARMDPLGFALENFDAIGKYRTADGHSTIDASGVLPDGTRFSNPGAFRQALLAHRSEFVRTFTERLATYALGRAVQYYDMPAIRRIVHDAASTDYRWSSLISGVVASRPFQMRKALDAASANQP